MQWYYDTSPDFQTRGGIENRDVFVERNMSNWKINRKREEDTRKKYYEQFLEAAGLTPYMIGELCYDYKFVVVGEVGPGPLGGMLEVCKLPAQKKVFIDYAMKELVDLQFIQWPDDAVYVNSAAERIPLPDNYLDVLLSYNCIDHGWNIQKAIDECFRISKKCFIAFDCRGNNEEEVRHRANINDRDHIQLLEFEDIKQYVTDKVLDGINHMKVPMLAEVLDMKINTKFPVALIRMEKSND